MPSAIAAPRDKAKAVTMGRWRLDSCCPALLGAEGERHLMAFGPVGLHKTGVCLDRTFHNPCWPLT